MHLAMNYDNLQTKSATVTVTSAAVLPISCSMVCLCLCVAVSVHACARAGIYAPLTRAPASLNLTLRSLSSTAQKHVIMCQGSMLVHVRMMSATRCIGACSP